MAPAGAARRSARATRPAMRHFTVAEANALLPEVRRLVADLRRSVGALDAVRETLKRDGEIARPEPDTLVAPGHYRAIRLFHLTMERLGELGIQVKDAREGLVDFPALSGGEEVLLCWKEGEESVRWFHDAESGFAGRRPIEELAGAFVPPPDEDDGSDEG